MQKENKVCERSCKSVEDEKTDRKKGKYGWINNSRKESSKKATGSVQNQTNLSRK